MAQANTVTVGTGVTQVYGVTSSPPAAAVQIINLDTANTVTVGYVVSISPGGTGIPLGPLASQTFDGSQPLYAVAEQTLTLAIAPGGSNYSPGSLTISGPVTAEITGPVEVEGAVSISGTPTVGVSGTVTVDVPDAVTVSSIENTVSTEVTNTVDTNITNTADVNVTNTTDIPVTVSNTVAVDATITNSPSVTVSNTVDTSVSNNVSVQNAAGGSLTVAGSVDIGNTPAVTVSGTPTVEVTSGTVDIGNTPAVTVSSGTVDIGSGSVSISGTPAVTLSGSSNQVEVTSGTVDIGNTPAVTVSGTPAVTVTSGTVSIGNTPAVTVSGTPNVAISSGTVDATITGTTDVSVQNATLDVIGSGGYVLPGQITTLFTSTTSSVTAGSTLTVLSSGAPFNITPYSSIDFAITSNNGSTASGAAYCMLVTVAFTDPTNSYVVSQKTFGLPVGGIYQFSVPCIGPGMYLAISNQGSTGTITMPVLSIFGSFRNLTDFQWNNYDVFQPSNDSTITWLGANNPAGVTSKWVSAGEYSPNTTNALYGVLFPPTFGPVTGFYQVVNNPFANDPVVIDMGLQFRQQITPGTTNNGTIINIPAPIASNPTLFSFNFPICCPALIIKAATTTAAVQFTAIQE